MKNNMLNKLRSDYEELEIKPSSDLWGRLDQKLDEKPGIVFKSSFQWWKYAAILVVLSSVGAIIYFNSDKNKLNYKETDYMVKKVLKSTVNSINPEFENQNIIINEDPIKKNEVKIVIENKKLDSKKIIEEKKEIIPSQISEFKTKQTTIRQSENIEVKSIKIESHIPNPPVIAEVKKTKSNYISSDELLFGREFDKTRENPYKKDVKFGVFNFDKPKVDNVTVLGVAVYVDTK
jgi:hypothetical protein